jgi:hypothetical protein
VVLGNPLHKTLLATDVKARKHNRIDRLLETDRTFQNMLQLQLVGDKGGEFGRPIAVVLQKASHERVNVGQLG